MKHTFKSLINVFFIIAVGYFISNISFLFLQKTPIFYYPYDKIISFYDIEISNLFYKKPVIKKHIKKVFSFEFQLNGIYNDGKKGFVILKDKTKTIFVDLGNSYKGYKLIKINLNNVVFEKDSKKYILKLKNDKNKKQSNVKPKKTAKKVYPKKIFHKIPRSLVRYYKINLRFIWQNVAINKTNKGYKITYLNPNSILGKLGLREGDILLEVNGVKLKNDSEAWNLYNNINKFDEVKIVILRNNKRKVFKYEIENS